MDRALPGLRIEQVNKAVESLLKYVGKEREQSKDLLADDETFYLLVSLKKTPEGKRNDKPIRLPLPHPIYEFEGAKVCLFVKDHKGEGQKEAKRQLQLQAGAGVAKVVGLSKLRTKYEAFEAKRQLLSQYDLFVADDRVLPSLPKLLGKAFFKKKKQPIPVDLTRKHWRKQIEGAVQATYMYKPTGACVSIRVARSSQSAQQVRENILAVLPAAVEKLPKKWKGVQALYLKTADSVALPLYQTLPDQGLRIAGGSGSKGAEADEEAD